MEGLLHRLDPAFGAEKLCQEHGAAGGAPQGVVAEADELIVVLGVRPQAADGHRHAVFQHPVQTGLGTVVLLKVVEELLGSGGEVQLLGLPAEGGPVRLDLLDGRLFSLKRDEAGCHMPI